MEDLINDVQGDVAYEPTPQMTFGEKLVGLTFNPSNDDKVAKAKKLCAELADLLYEETRLRESSRLSSILENNAYSEILNAQMNVVKVLTLKY
jgi:hypothetical protein